MLSFLETNVGCNIHHFYCVLFIRSKVSRCSAHSRGWDCASIYKDQETRPLGVTQETDNHIGFPISVCWVDEWTSLGKGRRRIDVSRGALLLRHGFLHTPESQGTWASKSLPLSTHPMLHFQDWLIPTHSVLLIHPKIYVCVWHIQGRTSHSLEKWRNWRATFGAQKFVNFFQKKGWGNLLIWGKAHFFHTYTTQIRLSTPKLEFSKPFPFLREREGNSDKGLFLRKKWTVFVVYLLYA